jgi:threonine/homoserine/homoserine lactone efflux protein
VSGAIWKALLFGAVLAGSIGPIALLIFGTAANRGLAAGAFAAAGAALADFVYALLAFSIGALLLPALEQQATVIRVACALLLTGLGVWMLLQRPADAAAAPTRPAAHLLLPVFLLTLVNPMTLVLFAGFVPQLPLAGSLPAAVTLALALAAGSLAVALAIAAAGAALGAALPGPGWQRAINLAAAAGILAFGLTGLLSAS